MDERAELYTSICHASCSLRESVAFPTRMAEIVARIQSAGISLGELSVYLMDENPDLTTHYFLAPAPVGWETIPLTADMAEKETYATRESRMWSDSESGGTRWHVTVPTTLGAMTVSQMRAGGFSAEERRLLEQLAQPLEMLVLRHRDLQALETARTRTFQADEDLAALYRGSYELSGVSQDDVLRKIIRMVITKLPFDRAGVFLRSSDANLLRGTWGVDGAGEIVPIPSTVFPLFPEKGEYVSEAALIARGELEYFLCQGLDAEGHQSIEGDIQASISVPMRVGDRIIGVLAADNYLTSESIQREQVPPLMILANQGAVALENTRLLETLRGTNDSLQRELAAHRQSQEKYRELTDLLPEVIFETALDGRITYVNRVAYGKFGYSEDDLSKGIYVQQMIAPPDRSRAAENVAEVLRGKATSGREYVAQRKDGAHFPVMIYSSPIVRDGQSVGLRGIVVDITQLKEAEKQKADLEARVRQAEKMEALGNLAGGVAHDLNNILSASVGFPDLLLMEIPEDSPLRRPLEIVRNSGERAAAIVQDLLTLARRGVSVRNIVNLNEIVSDFLGSPEFAKLREEHPRLKLKTHLADDLRNLEGSAVHLAKTVMNLVLNAAEAMPRGGELALTTRNCCLERPVHGYERVETGEYVVLTVADTGSGIAPEDLSRVFEPFYTSKRLGRSGTGLGMTVVWGTVKDHEGYIDLRSRVGAGTTLTLYFPSTRSQAPRTDPVPALKLLMSAGESVLVVDDVEDQRELAALMLRKLGYAVAVAASGEEAVAYLEEATVDLLVLDMIMDPGMDGLDTYRRILARHPEQKAIITSGFSESDRVQEAQALGAGAFVRKPYSVRALGAAVKRELIHG